MSTTNTEAQPGSGGEALPPASSTPPPTNDAQAALQEQAAADAGKEKATPPPAEPQKKPNRTGEYIGRLQTENQTMRRELDELKRRLPPEPKATAPDPKDFYDDPREWSQRNTEFAVQQAREQWAEEQKQHAEAQENERVWNTYKQRLEAFAADKPDFHEVVTSIRFPLADATAAAIAAHESGPAIAYELGLNEKEAFDLARTPPQLVGYALDQIASRLKAAPPATEPPPPSPPAAPADPNPKTISQAPAPAPRVGGRSPTEVPEEKMTDEQWYKRDVERRRKR